MQNRHSLLPTLTAIVAGALIFVVFVQITGRKEPWDAPVYWKFAYPIAIALCATLGYSHPVRPWRWALWMFEAQFVAMCIHNREPGNLWPLGMALFAIVAVPAAVAASLAAKMKLVGSNSG